MRLQIFWTSIGEGDGDDTFLDRIHWAAKIQGLKLVLRNLREIGF